MALRAALFALAFAALATVSAPHGARRAASAAPLDATARLSGRALLQDGASALPQQLGRPTATPRVAAAVQAQAQTAPLPPATLGTASVGALADRPTGVPRARPAEPQRP